MDDTSSLIEAALAAREFEMLIGRAEDGVFEAKGAKPYDFTQPQAQYELAKDVSAFANAEGGWIIVGLRTGRVPERAGDTVEALDLLASVDFAVNELKGRIRSFVRPDVAGLELQWVEHVHTPGHGLGVIRIPKQDPDQKPFLIHHVIESGVKLNHIVFGYAHRAGDASNPLSFEQIQQRMKTGMNTTAQRLTHVESQLDEIKDILQAPRNAATPLQPTGYDLVTLKKRIEDLLRDQ